MKCLVRVGEWPSITSWQYFRRCSFSFLLGSQVPHLRDHLRNALQEMSSQVLPDQVSQLLQKVMDEINQRARSGLQLISVCAGALWAAFNGTWAMIYGLNKAYEVEENRSWWQLTITIVGLTLSLAITGSIAVVLIFCSAYLQARFHGGAIALRCLEWLVLAATLSVLICGSLSLRAQSPRL